MNHLYKSKLSVPHILTAVFCLIPVISLITKVPAAIYEWNAAWYAMDYSLGFGSRLLTGSLLKSIFPDYLYGADVRRFVLLALVVSLTLLFLLFAYTFIKTDALHTKNGLALLIILYLVSPCSPASLWSSENFGRFDTYLFLLIILCVLLCQAARSYPVRCLIVLIACSICLAIHQVFLFLYFPIIFLLLILPIHWSRKKSDKRDFLFGTATIGLCLVQFLYYQFAASLSISSMEELIDILRLRTDLPISELALYYEFFAPFSVQLKEIACNEIGERIRYTAIAYFILSPILILYGSLWIKILRNTADKVQKYVYLLSLLSLFSYLPAFLLTKDWGRWTCALFAVLLLQMIILLLHEQKEGREAVGSAFLSLSHRMKKYWFLIMIYIGVIALLDKFQCILLPQAPDIFLFIYHLLRG